MYAEILFALTRTPQNFLASTQKFNQLAISQVEKIVTIQTASLQNYTNLGIAQWKAASEVTDPWSFLTYLTKQGVTMTKIGEQVVGDAKKLSELGAHFMDEARTVAQEEARAIGGALGESAKAVAKKAA